MLTVKQMKALERTAQKKGIFAADLMENAGRGVASAVREKFDLMDKHIAIFAGSGNNGGDGFVAARYFSVTNPVVVLFFGEKEKLSEEALNNYEKIFNKINVIKISSKEDLKKFHFQNNHKLVLVDAMLGTGVKGTIRQPVSWGIDYYNSLNGMKVTVDVPSGINADTGRTSGKSCDCDLIVTFHDIKVGLEKFKEKTVVVDIGIPH